MKLVIALSVLFVSTNAVGEDLALCTDPKGTGYYAEIGPIGRENSGWTEDGIAGGITKLVRSESGEYDILYVDVLKEIASARAQGARVVLLNSGKNVFSFFVNYPEGTAEVYTFLKTRSGKLEYMHMLSRTGDGVRTTTKASVMRGDCSYIKFDALSASAARDR